MRAPISMTRDFLKLPIPVVGWLGVLMAANMVAPLFFLGRLEARVVIGAFMASFVLMVILHARLGFTRILGLGHLIWLPLVIYLGTRLGQAPGSDVFGVWIRAVIVLDSISLVFDGIDVGRYFAGNRTLLSEATS